MRACLQGMARWPWGPTPTGGPNPGRWAGGLGGADGDQGGGDAAGGLAARFDGAVGEGPGLVEQGCGGGEEGRWCGLQARNRGVEGVSQSVDLALVFAGDGAAVRLLQAREGGEEGAVLDRVGGEMVEPGADDGFEPGEGAELLGADGDDKGVGEFGEDVGDQLGVGGVEEAESLPRDGEVGGELLAIDGGWFSGGEQTGGGLADGAAGLAELRRGGFGGPVRFGIGGGDVEGAGCPEGEHGGGGPSWSVSVRTTNTLMGSEATLTRHASHGDLSRSGRGEVHPVARRVASLPITDYMKSHELASDRERSSPSRPPACPRAAPSAVLVARHQYTGVRRAGGA